MTTMKAHMKSTREDKLREKRFGKQFKPVNTKPTLKEIAARSKKKKVKNEPS